MNQVPEAPRERTIHQVKCDDTERSRHQLVDPIARLLNDNIAFFQRPKLHTET
jgi:hypothetical protein